MKREIIDASKLELEDKVVAIKRVTKVVKGGRNSRVAALSLLVIEMATLALVLARQLRLQKLSVRVRRMLQSI